jgi:hypothetical protein
LEKIASWLTKILAAGREVSLIGPHVIGQHANQKSKQTMKLMSPDLYEALIEAGASNEKAKAAAAAIGAFSNQIQSIKADLAILKWMVGTNIVISAGVLIKLLR